MSDRFEASAVDLALFRLVVCLLTLWYVDVGWARDLAAAPSVLRVVRTGWAFPLAWIPADPHAAEWSGRLLQLGCLLGAVGLATRPALALATVAGLYHLGIGQHLGAVMHHHHLVWFLALLAASPCADVLSIDAARAAAGGSARPSRRALRYGVPIWAARALIVVLFLFPGIWKLVESGWAWAASDNLRNQMYWKWFEFDRIPGWRIDRHPWLLKSLAGAALVFELSLAGLLWSRRLRPLAAASALGFHAFAEVFLFIRFTVLWPCYLVLIDPHDCMRRVGARLFRRKLVVEAPAACIAALRSGDVLGRVIYRESEQTSLPWLRLSLRHPLAWPLTWLARRPAARHARRSGIRRTAVVALLLLAGNTIAGVTGTT